MRAAAAAVLALALLAGCGGGGGGGGGTTSSRTPTPTGTETTITVHGPKVKKPATTTTPTTTTTTSPEEQPGGAGDENAPRVPARFTYRAGRLTPPVVNVPATFRVAVTITFADGPHTVRIGRSVVAGVTRYAHTFPGVPKGKALVVQVDGRAVGRIAGGLNPGP